jgi:dynein heavy chain
MHFEKKYDTLLASYKTDLDDVHRVFLAEKDRPPAHPNMAPVTGAVAWTHELKDRIAKTVERLIAINSNILSTDEGKMVKAKQDEVNASLEAYEVTLFDQWAGSIIDESESNLAKPLLVRDEAGLLHVNFDPKVVALLREVKYFEALSIKVPEKAHAIFAKSDTYRNHILSLEHIVKQYNAFRTNVLPVEAPLIAAKLADIDRRCERVRFSELLSDPPGDFRTELAQRHYRRVHQGNEHRCSQLDQRYASHQEPH